MYDNRVRGTSRSTQPLGVSEIERRLIEICGPQFARRAGAADQVAGVSACWVAAPGSVRAAAQLLRLAAAHELSVVPRGAGTKIDWGIAPSRLDLVVDTGRLAGIRYEGDSATVEVGAGTPLRAVQAVLKRAGKRVALDAPSSEATIGGVVIADEPGPLRHRHGAPGDQLAGLDYLDADGGLSRTDGSALGQARVLCGSQGALGVLVSASLRVQPLPASRRWVFRSIWTPLQIHDLVRAVAAAPVEPAAIEVDLPGATDAWRPERSRAARQHSVGTLAVLLEGEPSEVVAQSRHLVKLLGEDATTTVRAPSWWRSYPFGQEEIALRVDVPVTDLHAAVYALRDAADAPVAIRGSAGLGSVHAVLPGTMPPGRVASVLAAVRQVLLARQGRCVVLTAPPPVRSAIDLWGELPTAPRLRCAKKRLDPGHRLAPGRLPGGL